MGGAAITKHFALGIPFFIVAFFLLNNGKVSADSYMEIMGPLMLISMAFTVVVAIFQNM
jgi:hypothetical protein